MATIAAIATGSSDFNVLVNALTFIDSSLPGTNLVATLDDAAQDLTVFAPTDAAFGRLARDLGFAGNPANETAVTNFLATTLGAETLRDVVLYHVSAGGKTLAEVAALGVIPTLNGATFTVDAPTLVDNEPDLLDPSLVTTDIAADNGVIHAIDRVLLPSDLAGNDAPTITAIVAASGGTPDADTGDFDILLTAVQAAGLAATLDDASLDATVFAPTDAAFIGLAQTLGFGGTDEAGALAYILDALELLGEGDTIGLLTTILTYHVAPESLQASQVLAADTIPTLAGPDITVSGTTLVDQDPDLADPGLVATDIQAANGIVHVIDGVLIPADILPSNGFGTVEFEIGTDGNNVLSGAANNDFLSGKGGRDVLNGGFGIDVLIGGDDRDFLYGSFGADVAIGGQGSDVIAGGHGSDELFGGLNSDVISGGFGGDGIFGGLGADRLIGLFGADTIDGGEGSDVMVGGAANDTFVFAEGYGRDVAVDFRNGIDRIDLTAFGFADFDEVAALAEQRDFGTVLNFGDGDALVLIGFRSALLDASDVLV